MALTQPELEQVAQAAHVALTPSEAAELTEQLNEVLTHIDKLHSLDTGDVTPISHGQELQNSWREDAVRPSLDQAEALANAPDAASGSFRVPRILDA